MMKRLGFLILVLALASQLSGSGQLRAATDPTYYVATIIPYPPSLSPVASWDIAWVDPASETFAFAERSNFGIDVVDARTNTFLRNIPGMRGVAPPGGPSNSGPNGLVIVPDPKGLGRGQAWAGDAAGKVVVADLDSGQIVASIETGGKARADELGYDPVHHIVLIADNSDSPQFINFISTAWPYPILGKLIYDGGSAPGHAVNATRGIEQPQFDPVTNHFIMTVPATTPNPGGEIEELDPVTMTIVATTPTSCNPAGITLGPNHEAFAACASGDIIVDLTGHRVLTQITQSPGGDEVWYNPGDGHYYVVGPQGVLHVVDAVSHTFIQDVMTTPTGRNLAADPKNNKIFVMSSDGVVVVTQRPPTTPSSATLDVVATGVEENPPIAQPSASVYGHFVYDSASQVLDWSLRVSGLSPDQVTSATLSRGAKGATGTVVATLSVAGFETLSGRLTLNAATIADLRAGNLFVNVSSSANKTGFARAQLALPAAAAPAAPSAITPPNTGDAGLLGSSSSAGSTLFALGGVIALTFAGLATAKFARR
jgi:hypothetical protein